MLKIKKDAPVNPSDEDPHMCHSGYCDTSSGYGGDREGHDISPKQPIKPVAADDHSHE